jgi:hypothetical protein
MSVYCLESFSVCVCVCVCVCVYNNQEKKFFSLNFIYSPHFRTSTEQKQKTTPCIYLINSMHLFNKHQEDSKVLAMSLARHSLLFSVE